MKYYLAIFLSFLLISGAIAQKENNVEHLLIGTWKFMRTEDNNGNKLDSYEGSFGTIQATGPKIIFKPNHTYKKIFRPQNVDIGKWFLNAGSMTIQYDLFIDSTDWIGQDLIKKGEAIKHEDGKYYERIEKRILKIEKDEMFIDNRGLIDVYKKIK